MKRTMWMTGCLAIWMGVAWADVQPPAAPPAVGAAAPEELVVDVTCILPATGPAVERGRLVARLYEYDARIADRAATEIARVELSGFSHRPGEETVLRFPCAGKTAARKAYYLTAAVYLEGAADDRSGLYFINGFQKVLRDGTRESLRVTLTPVDAAGAEPSN
ncbi:MAG TPA: hypothetical protein DCM68_08905 [Verrucomicrobia bacterium]|nr:hypothetical protein [Verrucomicrobiota bacterium]